MNSQLLTGIELETKIKLISSIDDMQTFVNEIESQLKIMSLDRVIEYAIESLSYLKNLQPEQLHALLLREIGVLYIRAFDNSKAEQYLLAALEITDKYEMHNIAISIKANLGILHFQSGRYQQAIEYYQSALSATRAIKANVNTIRILNNSAIVYSELGDYELALSQLFEAVEIGEQCGSTDKLANTINTIGNIYSRTDELDKAQEYYLKALAINEQTGDRRQVSVVLINLGNLMVRSNRMEAAIDFYVRSITIKEELIDRRGIALAHLNLAEAYHHLKRWDEMIDSLNRCIPVFEELTDTSNLIHSLETKAHYFIDNSQFNQGHELLLQAIDLVEKIGSVRIQMNLHYKLALVNQSMGNLDRSIQQFLRYDALRSQFLNEEKISTQTKMEARFQVNQALRDAATQQEKATILEKLNRKLDEAQREKQRIVEMVAHDLKNPLLTIDVLNQQMLFESDPTKGKHRTQQISNIVQRMLNQIANLDYFNNLETLSQLLKIQPIAFDRIIDYIIDQYRPLGSKKDISIEWQKPSHPAIGMADPSAFEQILENLISNAIKYSPTGTRIIVKSSVLCADAPSTSGKCRISIQDEGLGIALEDQSNIFQQFGITQNRPTGTESSSGVGLAITKSLVESMAGAIGFKSELGSGSTFWFELPLASEEVAQSYNDNQLPLRFLQPPSTSTISEAQTETKSRKPIRRSTDRPVILLVDDNVELCDELGKFLSRKFEIHYAYDGEAGLQLAREILPDIIVSDVMMPRMNGFELLQFVKQDEILHVVPVVLLTARSSEMDQIAGLKGRADYYVTKPFKASIIETLLTNIVTRYRDLRKAFAKKAITVQSEPIKSPSYDEKFVQRLRDAVMKNLDNPNLSPEDFVSVVNLSESQLRRKLKLLTDLTPLDFIMQIRLNRALEFLTRKNFASVSEVAYSVGFRDPNYFYRSFKKLFGKSPSDILNR